MSEASRVETAVAHLHAKYSGKPKVGIVLGSGLGAVAESMHAEFEASYADLPGFHSSAVDGHAGRLFLGRIGAVEVAVLQGRVHLYEGHPIEDVVLPVRVLVGLGAKNLIITNAAGGINPNYSVGDVMVLSDHLNLTGQNPLVGVNEEAFGPRFPDMSHAYDPAFRAIARRVVGQTKVQLREGVYAGLLGPSYETPAEIRMLRTLGADAVGMSTVLEVIAAHHMGARILGLSCISNAAAGMTAGQLSHDEVKAAADSVQSELTALITGIVQRIGI